jgi:methylglutaconyl-CoA hydratase
VGKDLVHCGPQAIGAIKRLLDETQGRPRNLRGAAAVSAAIRVSEEAQEGIQAFLEKRPPRWAETHS